MALRRSAVAALVLAVTGTLVPGVQAAHAAQPPDHEFSAKRLPRPEHSRDRKEREFDPRAVLVRFKPDASKSAKDKALSRRGIRATSDVSGTRWVKVHGDAPAADLMRTLRDDPAVAGVSLDYKRTASVKPNDPGYYYGDQSYLDLVRLPQAWDRTKGSTAQIIAVVDTGVNTTHPDLVGRTVAGYNAIRPGASPADDNGHGTMVAGIAAANTNNGVGVAGAAWTGRVMPIKVLDNRGWGYDSDIANGVIWAADHGAKIINMSLGGPGDNTALHDAITYATGKGALVVAAAGNDGDGVTQYPAAYSEVLSVAATDGAGKLTDFSSYGDWIDVAAPGAEIVSTGLGSDYYIGDGTSFSAPLVSGTAALVRTLYPSLTPAQVLSQIRSNARDAGPRGIDPYYGYGILDAYAAVGGTWAAEFPAPSLGANEPNDVPARATALGASITGTIGAEGDVDWYKFSTDGLKAVDVTVRPAAFNPYMYQNLDPVLAVYDSDLRLVGESDLDTVGAPENVSAKVDAGTYYVSVRNYNGSADTRPYTLSLAVANTDAQPSPVGEQRWVRDVSPADFAAGVPVAVAPTVTFARDVDPATVTSSTVRLINGRTGAVVAATVSISGNEVTLAPAAALQDNTPYRITVSGVADSAGAAQVENFSTVFRTEDLAPPAVGNLKAVGALQGATLSWTLPNITDLDQVVVRAAAGTVAPSSPNAGIAVYAGTGSSATATGLAAGTSYAFRVWVRDRSGRYGSGPVAQLLGTSATISSKVTALNYGGAVTLTGKLARKDTGAGLAGQTVQVYGRYKGATSFTLIATVTSGTNGALSYTHKPAKGVSYEWLYRGSTTYLGSVSSLRTVTVATVVSSKLSKTSFRRGGTVTLSGSVSPKHAGQTVYLQRLVNGSWKNVTSKKLSSSSSYSFSIKPTSRGTFTYRVYKPADTDHAAGYSPRRSFKVT
ncbi:S8 family serine peptidase [Micromonospora sp. NPDC093277]|uniref:S8 family serine peptidase n=1 Tax=Micromonospora sp. NPDC093277 TaxID=3364291 RepID=UPI00380AC5C4